MKHYVTAAEARVMALEAQSIDGAYMRKETDFIMKNIIERAASGQTTLAVFENIDNVVINRVKHLGYDIKIYDDQRDGQSCTISW